MNWHRLNVDEVFELLGTGVNGLTEEAAEVKLAAVGLNQLEEGRKKSMLGIFLSQFKDVMILILLSAAVISGVIGDLSDTIVILIIVLLNSFVGFLQEYRAEKRCRL